MCVWTEAFAYEEKDEDVVWEGREEEDWDALGEGEWVRRTEQKPPD